MAKCVMLVSILALIAAHPFQQEELSDLETCGYSSCPVPKPGMLNVHLVPHTHDDVGWLKTVDQYYFGSRTNIQNAGVQYIIDSVVNELLHDPNKKFIYVETSFFWKWWKEQDDHTKHRVKQLIKKGQLEFIGGAWSMNDEATTHYHSIIDQFTWGFRKLNDTFGSCARPKIGWQIDPFGHSREMASMMAQFGFDGLFFGRLDYQDKDQRLATNTMEMIWKGNPTLGSSNYLMTGVLYNFYSAPKGFCFDILCDDDPIIDDRNSPEFNADKRVDDFISFAQKQAKYFKTRNIVMTFGMDFNFQFAHKNFKNMDKLMRYVNERQKVGSNVNVFYSTPSCYVKSLNDANTTWPTKEDDFFPYASDPHAFWTGYFTSRPTLKYFERKGNNMLQICKQLSSLALLGPEDNPDIDALREAMGIMQHHDAITGTEKQHVADDYARILTEGLRKCGIVSSTGLNKLMAADSSTPSLEFNFCPLMNISECAISTESEKFIVTVYNPLSRPVSHYVRLPVAKKFYSVRDPKGQEVPAQMVPIPQPVVSLPGRTSNSAVELVFKTENIPPLGFRSYYVSTTNSENLSSIESESVTNSLDDFIIGDMMKVTVNGTTGLLSSINVEGKTMKIAQNLEYYIGSVGNNQVFENRSSGAYIFRPKTENSFTITNKVNSTAYKGKLVSEIHQVFAPWASQVIRQYSGEQYVEAEWLIGPIPIDDGDGKEIITKYMSDLDNDGVFYTDSNGRQTIKRKRNFRPTWNLDLKEPVAGNYYPITTDISINNGDLELTVLTDRAEGGSSLKDGEIELMLHRRLLHDDAFGVDEALNEQAYNTGLVARGRHWLLLGNLSNPNWESQKRLLLQQTILSPQVVLADATSIDFDSWKKNYKLEYSGLTESLPPQVQILTLEPWQQKTYLLRLEHLLETNDTVDVDLSKLFSAFDIVRARETSLGADRWLEEVSRLKWKEESNEVFEDDPPATSFASKFPIVTLKAKQIRTFVCDIKPKGSAPLAP